MNQGQFCFLEDQYYKDFPDDKLMKNKEVINDALHDRPCFFAFPDNEHPDIVKNAREVIAMTNRGAVIVFPDIKTIYSELVKQLDDAVSS